MLLALCLLTPLTSPIPVLVRLQDGAILYGVSDIFTAVALHVTAVVPCHPHGNAAACDRLSVRNVIDMHDAYDVPDFVQIKVPLLVTGVPYPLVLGRKVLENDVFVKLIVHRLPHFLADVTEFIQHELFRYSFWVNTATPQKMGQMVHDERAVRGKKSQSSSYLAREAEELQLRQAGLRDKRHSTHSVSNAQSGRRLGLVLKTIEDELVTN